jgi:peptidyl-tRNA hydrolase, PTH1 family
MGLAGWMRPRSSSGVESDAGDGDRSKSPKMIVGLGNPGQKYDGTRHNVGFLVIAELKRRHATGRVKNRFQGEFIDAVFEGRKLLLLCPSTFMNRSGNSVSAAKEFYRLKPEDILVVCDDLNLPTGRLRCRTKGSAGGQKGLQNIIDRLRTQEFARLRIGIGSPPPGWEASSYVLGKFAKGERSLVEETVLKAADAAETWYREDALACMNRFNGS